ncbi:SMEK domain-containing protein [Pseudoalteromonas rubra]|uniref:SMEK domain-containing protein n=1 Tax=Pseudoalteromonas rubra TaxID=43658 RepID=A0A5S3X1W1_9GAMM|nr:SMEK domain-containing protein [Pseudoalteromonas rubra]TMP38281.1 hypothetical protein CWB98_07285 [Pseudoalteromonas rubra]
MTLDEREKIIKKISRTLSIMMCDIKLNQSLNIYSMNIHSEDFFCNIFNYLWQNKNFKNANSASSNEAYIDLIDHSSKHLIQVTSSTGKNKIDNSLKILESSNTHYRQYEFEIYYLLDKPKKLKKETIKYYNEKFGIEDINDHLKDFTDLLNDIKNLPDSRLESIYRQFFREVSEKYTDEIALQIVFESLIKDKKKKKIDYSESFNNVNLTQKIKLNGINIKVSSELHRGSEASLPIYESVEDTILTELRELIVEEFYATIIKQALSNAGASPKELANQSIDELHALINNKYPLNISAALGDLSHRIEEETREASYNETSMAWVIISYFFEECDIGLKL